MGVALGELGMTAGEFWEMRLHDFFLKLRYHYNVRQTERVERAELVRMQTVALVNIQLARKDRIKDPRQFWRFPWEAEQGKEPEGVSEEEQQERIKNLIKAL